MHRTLACPAKAPFGASPTLCLRQLSAANLVVQLDMPRLQAPTKSWLDWNVSLSERTHGTALERVRAGQCPVPLAAAGATQCGHKISVASSPGPFGGRQAEPAPTGCRSAGPTPTCCRRIAHESVGHRLEPPDSSRTEDSEACAPQKGRNPTACFTGAEFGGFNLWPPDSSIEPAAASECRLSLPAARTLLEEME